LSTLQAHYYLWWVSVRTVIRVALFT